MNKVTKSLAIEPDMVSTALARSQLAAAMSESELQSAVIELAKLRQWRVTHFTAAPVRAGKWVTPLQGDPGFADLVLARKGIVIFLELKSEKGRLTKDQELWRDALGLGRHFVIRPSDWQSGLVERLLS